MLTGENYAVVQHPGGWLTLSQSHSLISVSSEQVRNTGSVGWTAMHLRACQGHGIIPETIPNVPSKIATGKGAPQDAPVP